MSKSKVDPKISKHMAALGRKRWKGTNKKDRSEEMTDLVKRRWEKLEKEGRATKKSKKTPRKS